MICINYKIGVLGRLINMPKVTSVNNVLADLYQSHKKDVMVRVYDSETRLYKSPNSYFGEPLWEMIPGQNNWYRAAGIGQMPLPIDPWTGVAPNEPRKPPVERPEYHPSSAQVERLFSDVRLLQSVVEAQTQALFIVSAELAALKKKPVRAKKSDKCDGTLCGEHGEPIIPGKYKCKRC